MVDLSIAHHDTVQGFFQHLKMIQMRGFRGNIM